MNETNIYIKVRYYGGAYIARVYEPKLKVQASSTNSAKVAVENCARKAAGREPLCIVAAGGQRFRAVFSIQEA